MLAKVMISYWPNSHMVLLDDRENNKAVLLSLRKFFWPLLTNTKSECMAHWLLANQIHKVQKGRGHKTFILESHVFEPEFLLGKLERSFYLALIFRLSSKFHSFSECLSTCYMLYSANVNITYDFFFLKKEWLVKFAH